jgi:hypothetical protein
MFASCPKTRADANPILGDEQSGDEVVAAESDGDAAGHGHAKIKKMLPVKKRSKIR